MINRFRRVATAEYFATFSIVATRRTIILCALVQAMNDLPKINRRSATKSIALRKCPNSSGGQRPPLNYYPPETPMNARSGLKLGGLSPQKYSDTAQAIRTRALVQIA